MVPCSSAQVKFTEMYMWKPGKPGAAKYHGITRNMAEYNGILRNIAKIFEIQPLESLESCLHMKSKRIYICCSLACELGSLPAVPTERIAGAPKPHRLETETSCEHNLFKVLLQSLHDAIFVVTCNEFIHWKISQVAEKVLHVQHLSNFVWILFQVAAKCK